MSEPNASFDVVEMTIADIAAAFASGRLTAEQLVGLYLERIATVDQQGPRLNSVLEVNPDALFIARALDQERRTTGPRGPLHGIVVLLKDNIDTADKMHTSAGSLALADSYAPRDSFVAAQLRKAGAVILGKVNMTEFANFMTVGMPGGYSSRGGQVLHPYCPGALNPSGSSAGSAVATAASLCTVAVGTETDGSILSPANINSVVGIKPTVGLVSRSGIIPIAMSQDTAGPLARTVADAVALLGALAGPDPADPATLAGGNQVRGDYTQFLESAGLRGARIGIARAPYFDELNADQRRLFEDATRVMREGGAQVEWVEVPSLAGGNWRSNVLTYEFKAAINAYLSSLGPAAPVRTLAEIIAFNNAHPDVTLRYDQKLLIAAEATSGRLTEPEYLLDRLNDLRLCREEGIDAVMDAERLDALLFPASRGSSLSARAGYPAINVPAGYTGEGHPFGITFTGRAWSEPTLIRLAYSYEQATRHRVAPHLSARRS